MKKYLSSLALTALIVGCGTKSIDQISTNQDNISQFAVNMAPLLARKDEIGTCQ